MGVFSFVLALNQLTNGAVTVSGVAQYSSETTDGALRIAVWHPERRHRLHHRPRLPRENRPI